MQLVAGKSRVVPLKILTIPRLELQVAVMGARLADTIRSELILNIDKIYFWSDSRTVLSWICLEPMRYKQFVVFRVSEILCKTHASEWHWIASKDNPADEATKRIKGDSIWISGPLFLKQSNFTATDYDFTTLVDIRPMFLTHSTDLIDFTVINSHWTRSLVELKRALAIGLLYMEWFKSKAQKHKMLLEITKKLLDRAENFLIKNGKWKQMETFYEDIMLLKIGKEISMKSPIRNFNPVLVADGLLRMKGRLTGISFIEEKAKIPSYYQRKMKSPM